MPIATVSDLFTRAEQLQRMAYEFAQDVRQFRHEHERKSEAARPSEPPPSTPRCPQCGSEMRQRRSARGPFWGCSQYPHCEATRPGESWKDETRRQ